MSNLIELMTSKSSNIILLNEGLYSYSPPINPPANEKEIINYQLKKDEQFWHTPPFVNVNKLGIKERIDYIEREWQRWHEGVYILINGELRYMTGGHYEHLTLNTYNSQKLLYFDFERDIFYFIDKTENDNTCGGRTWIKGRRVKMTTIMCSLCQRKLLSGFSNYVVIQCDTLDKAQKSYMNPIIDSYTRRPLWAREEYYAPNGKKPRKALELRSNVVVDEEDEPMGGTINIFPAIARATDGLEAVESVLDEFSKWEESSPYETFEVNRKVVQTFRKEGKVDALSSSGDSKDAVKATMDWHKLIANSSPLKKDPFGKTTSGNWEFFISAIHSQYVPKEFTDKFGIVDKARAEEWIWNEIKKYPESTREYIFALYKLPLKKEHALLSSAIVNLFNKIRISLRLTELDGMLPHQKPYVRGRLDENVSGEVWFEEDPAGYWLWSVHPYYSIDRGIDLRNRWEKVDGIYFPARNAIGVIGYDPINYPKAMIKSTNISQAAAFVHAKWDYFDTGIEDEKCGFLLYRPDDPHDANREIMKACRYTGYPCMHERSIPHCYEDFRDNGMLPFLMKGEDGIWGTPIYSNGKNLRDGISMLQARYSTPKKETDKDHIAIYPFEDGLRSLDNFDPSNTTQFHPTMAEIQTEFGLKYLKFTNQTERFDKSRLQTIMEIFPARN